MTLHVHIYILFVVFTLMEMSVRWGAGKEVCVWSFYRVRNPPCSQSVMAFSRTKDAGFLVHGFHGLDGVFSVC